MVPVLLSATNVTQTLSLLERCSNMKELKQIHAQMFKTRLILQDIPTSRLLAFCTLPDSGNLTYAEMVFNQISFPNTFMWNTMIKGYSNSKKPEAALLLYHQMLFHLIPHNAYTFPSLLKACSTLTALEETKQIHTHIMKRGFGSEIHTTNSLLHVYVKSGSVESARLLFDLIPRQDVVSWNSMIDGYSKEGEMEMALDFFENMPEKNIISWTTMISGYVRAGRSKDALDLFHKMQIDGVNPDSKVLACVISACAELGTLDQGRWIHAYIEKNRIPIDSTMGCVLIDMYAKCGDTDEALEVFRKIEKKCVYTWTAMITGFAIHGRGRQALDWFMKMQEAGVKPNSITYTAVLTACSYAGLVEEGKSLFKTMKRVHTLNPSIQHYGCMVDLLGRAGLLKEARKLIETMPMVQNASIWGALLKACRIHGNIELGERIGKILIQIEPDHGGRYIHLASIYAMVGDWDQASKVRRHMKDQGVLKLPGCSAISVNGTRHDFFAGDRSHPHMKEMNKMWRQIEKQLKGEGYKPVIGELLLDLEDNEKETAIHQHSEKLAIAFGLISTEAGTSIRIVKNLRVCEDCHTVTKLISKIYAREIIVRDRSRFHLFRDGECTCRDYW